MWRAVLAAVSLRRIRAMERSLPEPLVRVGGGEERRLYTFGRRGDVAEVYITPARGHAGIEVSWGHRLAVLCKTM